MASQAQSHLRSGFLLPFGVGIALGAFATRLYAAAAEKRSRKNEKNFEKKRMCGISKYGQAEWRLRVELAAAYRIASDLGWDEVIFNHISVRVPGTADEFLINPFGLRFDEVTASSLIKVNSKGKVIDPGTSDFGFNWAGFIIHGAIHDARSDVNCVFHTHDKDMQAVANMKCGLLPLSLEACSCLRHTSKTSHDFFGITTDERERPALIKALGLESKILFLKNHGTIACGSTIAEAFYMMYTLSRACMHQVTTLSAVGGNLSQLYIPEEKVAQGDDVGKRIEDLSQRGEGSSDQPRYDRPFYAMMRKMEQMDPSFMT